MRSQLRLSALLTALLTGCASTTVTLTPSPQAPGLRSSRGRVGSLGAAMAPRPKDVPQREAVAHAGLQDFFSESQCFARSELRRLPDLAPETIATQLGPAASQFDFVLLISVHEFGPVVRLLNFPALVEGATEVVLHVTTYQAPAFAVSREFTVHWRNGGPGVIKGVTSLSDDFRAALRVALQPATQTR